MNFPRRSTKQKKLTTLSFLEVSQLFSSGNQSILRLGQEITTRRTGKEKDAIRILRYSI